MNISNFVVLGTLEMLGTASGYDIIRELDKKMISKWTDVKRGSIYYALKTLSKGGEIIEVDRVKHGTYPTMTLYQITDQGKQCFDEMQEKAFLGLFPLFLGFKLALKFNTRRTPQEIRGYALKAIDVIDKTILGMDAYLDTLPSDSARYKSDAFFIEHDRMLYLEEKKWIQMVLHKWN